MLAECHRLQVPYIFFTITNRRLECDPSYGDRDAYLHASLRGQRERVQWGPYRRMCPPSSSPARLWAISQTLDHSVAIRAHSLIMDPASELAELVEEWLRVDQVCEHQGAH